MQNQSGFSRDSIIPPANTTTKSLPRYARQKADHSHLDCDHVLVGYQDGISRLSPPQQTSRATLRGYAVANARPDQKGSTKLHHAALSVCRHLVENHATWRSWHHRQRIPAENWAWLAAKVGCRQLSWLTAAAWGTSRLAATQRW